MTVPFLAILPCVILGILLSGWVGVPNGAIWAMLAAAWGMGWLTWRRGAAGRVYVAIALIMSGMTMARVHETTPVLPEGQKILLHLRITDNAYENGRWQHTLARVGYWRQLSDDQWNKANQKILLSIDTCYPAAMAQELICASFVNPIDRSGGDTLSGYARLMNIRGIWGRTYLVQGQLIAMAPERPTNPATIAKELQRAASERLARLDLTPEQAGVATTMTTGERRGLSASLRASYSRVGASHLLAVSGLHVGIVFVLVNLLLFPLPLLRRGHIARSAIAIAAIWLFAAMTGLAPSAMRAALMFTGAQVALATSSRRSAMNLFLATCTIMLLLNPANLYDVSFQLSASAVLFIMLLYRPLYDLLKTRWSMANFAIGASVVGFAATLGTAPLVAYYFHNFPLVGLLTNLPVILTAHAIVLLSLIWILLPVSALAPAFGWLIGAATGVQNAIVEWFAGWPMAAFRVELSGWGVAGIYLIYAVVFYGAYRFRHIAKR